MKDGTPNKIEQLTWKGCTDLARDILLSRPGEWRHTIDGKPVRFEKRVIVPSGQVRVFFRGEDCGGSWSAEAWERDAKETEFQQLTLF